MRLSSYSGRGLSAGAVIALCGVALALMVMELTLAVVTGFKHQITHKVMGFDSQVSIGAPYDYSAGEVVDYICLNDTLATVIEGLLPGHLPVLALQQPGMIKTEDDFAGMLYVAHGGNYDYSFERGNMVEGIFPDFSLEENHQKIVVSKHTATMLGLEVGSRVYSCFFVDGNLKTRRHDVVGIYESNLGEYDKVVVYASLSALQQIAGVDPDSGSKIEFSGFDANEIRSVATEMQNGLASAVQSGVLGDLYTVTTVFQTGAIYFNWLSLLDTNVVVIFILMLCVAGFTLVSSLFIIVLDRVNAIGVLRSLGASRRLVANVFLGLGLRLTLIGMLIGNIFGLGIALLQHYTHIVKLDPDMYYLRYVPVEINPFAFICLNVGVLLVAWLVLYIPAKAASRLDPTETMRID